MENTDLTWETVIAAGTDTLQRVRVPCGWLYRTVIIDEKRENAWETAIALCFVPSQATHPLQGCVDDCKAPQMLARLRFPARGRCNPKRLLTGGLRPRYRLRKADRS